MNTKYTKTGILTDVTAELSWKTFEIITLTFSGNEVLIKLSLNQSISVTKGVCVCFTNQHWVNVSV